MVSLDFLSFLEMLSERSGVRSDAAHGRALLSFTRTGARHGSRPRPRPRSRGGRGRFPGAAHHTGTLCVPHRPGQAPGSTPVRATSAYQRALALGMRVPVG